MGPPRILLTGAAGQVGCEIPARAAAAGLMVTGLDHAALDIADEEAVRRAFHAAAPDVVINAAAYTKVDKAEDEPDRAFAVNAVGPGLLARACAEQNIPLLHISTDYVFDGDAHTPYREGDAPRPQSVYGASKLAGEEAVRRLHGNHIILRTSWLFGAHGPNFVRTMLRLAEERDEVRVVDDQLGCPTYAGHLADALVALSAAVLNGHPGRGTYHYSGGEAVTWCAFARAILAGSACRVRAIATRDYPTPARRPAYSVLDCTKIGHDFDIRPSDWRAGLAEMRSGKGRAS